MTIEPTTNLASYMNDIGQRAKQASALFARADTATKNQALAFIKDELVAHKDEIRSANAKDVENAKQKGIATSLIDRLIISDKVFSTILSSLDDVMALADPIGEISSLTYRPSGIQLGKMRVPLGVIAMIYESRPNVTIEAASLAIKSGNAIMLRGGSEAFYSNQALAKCVHLGLSRAGLPTDGVQVLATTDRDAVDALITMTDVVDVVIPRGGRGLIERIANHARVPVIKHLDGNCHTYVDSHAELDMAIKVCTNAKTSRYSPCNVMETLLVHEKVADDFLPKIAKSMHDVDNAMLFKVCEKSQKILENQNLNIENATDDDWYAEYLAPILAVKVVDDLSHAICHINHYGSHHTDVIITNHYAHAQRFIREVDSSSVMVNASSRFADGFEYGLGAEIGISTDKIHARGPVGLHGLTSEKWVVFGQGEIRV